MSGPLPALWTGEGFDILPAGRQRADAEMVIGQRYVIEAMEERSAKAHRFYFASVRQAWTNLSDEAMARYPTPDHLRKWALIKCGFRHERSIVCASRAEALRVAAFVKGGDEYAIVIVSGAVVTAYTAKSQRGRAMDKATFQASSAAVLALLAEMIGVTPAALERAA